MPRHGEKHVDDIIQKIESIMPRHDFVILRHKEHHLKTQEQHAAWITHATA